MQKKNINGANDFRRGRRRRALGAATVAAPIILNNIIIIWSPSLHRSSPGRVVYSSQPVPITTRHSSTSSHLHLRFDNSDESSCYHHQNSLDPDQKHGGGYRAPPSPKRRPERPPPSLSSESWRPTCPPRWISLRWEARGSWASPWVLWGRKRRCRRPEQRPRGWSKSRAIA